MKCGLITRCSNKSVSNCGDFQFHNYMLVEKGRTVTPITVMNRAIRVISNDSPLKTSSESTSRIEELAKHL